ncbi:lipopolysaccharide biosynthesis protein [Mariniradius saccharolyticus AK6]|uniref:Lipopolysaccharide biosynthesis protein n=1 Tax=Mariniradius saccharolyticus AK6 TaxID=1239962 RepID=M7XDJ2_9BACT|nr:LPS biosynthesis protein [Mariniradius saccharolyticus]EMS32939.1 lipopolysaccharide biosynthesis protein [Mariniradius saccharolyticus AK6]
MKGEDFILDDKLTLRDLVLKTKSWFSFFLGQWKTLAIAAVLGIVAGAMVSIFKKPVYHAETTFVLEDPDSGGMGQISGLASLLGINLGSMSSTSGVFQGENIMELYKSDIMLSRTLLSPFDQENLLIDRYIAFHKLEDKWSSKVDLSKMDFSKPRENFTVTQDSVVKEIAKLIREKHLTAEKPNRKLSIIQVTISSKDELFAKTFNEALVEKVNNFYYETKTKKSAENLAVLQHQADSVRAVLDQNLSDLAGLSDRIPYPNALLQTATVDSRKKQIDVQASSAVFAEITKNLEIAKVNHRNNSPLIQIIDSPILPLKNTRIKMLKGTVLGALVFVFATLFWLFVSRIYQRHIQAT